MKAIGIVLSAFFFCVLFVIFLIAFVQVPFLVLGVFLLIVTRRRSRRAKAPAAAVPAEGPHE